MKTINIQQMAVAKTCNLNKNKENITIFRDILI